jgi:HEAT repeat protein
MLKPRSAFFFALLLSVPMLSAVPARADEATDQTLAQIEAAVKAGKASPQAIHEWITLLNNSATPISVKERAAWGLGFVGGKDKGTVPALLTASEHKGLLVRSAAVNSLIRLRAPAALPTLTQVAKQDPILSVRRNATLGLGLLGSDKAIPALVELATDATPDVKGAAALAMSALQSKKNDFTQAIESIASDDNPYVQERTKDGLLMARRKNADVRNLLSSPDQDIRLFAALYFLRNGRKADQAAVVAAYNGESDDDVRKLLADANIAIKKRTGAKKSTAPAHHKKKRAAKKTAAAK